MRGADKIGATITERSGRNISTMEDIWFAVDVDGTIAEDHGIPWPTRRILREARRSGAWVVLASGRRPAYLRALHDQLSLQSPLVALDGGRVETVGNQAFDYPMDPDSVSGLAELARLAAVSMIEITNRAGCLKVVLSGSAEGLNLVTAQMPDAVRVVNRFPNAIEFVARGCSKGSGLRKLVEYYGRPSRLIAFGNDWNDREMFLEADVACVLPSAPLALQQLADEVLDPIAMQPVARWIDKFIHHSASGVCRGRATC